jgi:tetratricopeptide (TPR) repeat protein
MSRVTSLTSMPEKQLNRLIRLAVLVLIVGVVAFTAFYVLDRYHPLPKASAMDAQIAAEEEVVRTNPGDIAARGTLADLYVQVKRYADAIVQYDAIVAAGKDEELAKMGRARANEALGNVDAAITDWQRVVEIALTGEMAKVDPNLATAYYELGAIAAKQDRQSDAVGFLEKSLAISQTDADTLYALGLAYTATGDLDRAASALRSAMSFVPVGWPDPYTALSAVYTKKGDAAHAAWASAMADLASGDVTGAIAGLTPLVSGPAAEEAMVGLGLAAETGGDTAKAATWYQRVLDIDPANPSAKLGMTRVRPISKPSAAANGASPAVSPSQKVP